VQDFIQNKVNKGMKREYFDHFYVAGFTYNEGTIVFSELEIGTPLKLEVEPVNPHDSGAVAIYYNEHKIGYIPSDSNYSFSKLLKCGQNPFDVRVMSVDKKATASEAIGVVVYVVDVTDKQK